MSGLSYFKYLPVSVLWLFLRGLVCSVCVLVAFPNRTHFYLLFRQKLVQDALSLKLKGLFLRGLVCSVCLCVLVVFPYRTHFYLLFRQTFSIRIVPETKRALPPWASLQCVCLWYFIIVLTFTYVFRQNLFKTHCH